jgi:TolB-like protein
MKSGSQNEEILRFDAYELNVRAGELYKNGRKIRLQVLPLRILAILLELRGQVVTRDELRERLWSPDTFVDFGHSLNTAIRKLRRALNDEAEKPRFIETLPRRGYRFVGSAVENLPAARSRKPFDSIAVLPFENASADPDTEYLSDGITESIIGSLSHLPKLRVMARSTVFRYKGQLADPQKVGNELNVRTVLTGRVVQRGDSLTIGTELVDVANGWRLWGEQYRGKLADLLAVQEEIADEISKTLRLSLTGEERKRLSKRPTRDAQAYQDYLRGRFYWNKRTADGVKKGIEYFEKAIQKDPNYPLAYVGLADSYNSLGFYAYAAPRHAFPKAKAAASRALEIDEALTEVKASSAYVKLYYDWDWSGAEKEFNRVVERNPAYAIGHLFYGDLLIAMGRFKEGIAETEKAQELDPLSLIIDAGVGWCFYFARQYDKAIEQLQKTLEMDPHFVNAHAWLGGTYLQQGLFPEAITEIRAANEISGGSHLYVALLAHAYGVAGNKAEAKKILDQLKEQSVRSYVSSYSIAEVCLALGDRNQAFAWLEKAYEERARALVMIKVEPKVDPLRSDPRFQDLQRRMNFPP